MTRLASAALAVLLCGAGAQAQPSELSELLVRASGYVQQFVEEFTNVVAEEDYSQERSSERRRLKSDFLLVRYPGHERELLSFRDVYEVNGRAVGDQQDRLTKLFLEPFTDAVRRAEEITRAASRHSLVELSGFSNPLLILAFLQQHYQRDFIFKLGKTDTKLGPTVRALELEERIVPSAANPGVRRTPLLGVAWIEEDTGRVVKTEARVGIAPNTSLTVTTFRFDSSLGINVPAEMRESRVGPMGLPTGRGLPAASAAFRGVATYRRFRRFEVKTDEAVSEPAAKP